MLAHIRKGPSSPAERSANNQHFQPRMNSDVTMASPRPARLRRFFGWLFSWRGVTRMLIVLAWVATAIGLFYAEETWRGRHAWNKYRQELEARGEQLDLKALIPKAIPDEQNFAAVPFVQSWLTDRNGKDARWSDNYSWAAGKISGPQKSKEEKRRRQFLDLNAWQLAFAALNSGATNVSQRFEAAKPNAASRAKAKPNPRDPPVMKTTRPRRSR